MRNLINNSNSGLSGYPITTSSPVNGNVLVFDSNLNQWIYTTISGTSDINNIISTGTQSSIINGITGNTLYLKGISSSGNLTIGNLSNDISVSLNSTLNNITEINNGLLYVNIPKLQSDNCIFTNIQSGTATKKLALDSLNNLIYDNSTPGGDITNAQNKGTGQGEVWLDKLGTVLRFRTLRNADSNISISTGAQEVFIDLSTSLDITELSNPTLYFSGIPVLPAGGNYNLFIDNLTNQIYKNYSLNTYSILGLGESIINSTLAGDLKVKSLIGGANITCVSTPSTLTFDLDNLLVGIQQINSNVDTLQINGNINCPNMPLQAITSGDYNIFIDSTNKLYKNFSINNLSTSGSGDSLINTIVNDTVFLKSLSTNTGLSLIASSNNIQINLDSTQSIINTLTATTLNLNNTNIIAPNISTGTEQFYLALDNTNKIIKVPSSTGNTNIYNSDGQLTTQDRVLQGFVIGGENRIIYDNINFSYQNNVRYAPNNLLLLNRDDIIYSASSSGSDTRALYSPYNYTSQKFTITGLPTIRSFRYFYQNILPLSGLDSSYKLDIDIYEITTSNNGFCASYELDLCFNSVAFGTVYSVKQKQSNVLNTIGNFNCVEIIFYLSVGGILNIGLQQLSNTASSSTYNIFIKDLSANGYKTAAIINSGGVLGALISNQYTTSLKNYMLTIQGNGTAGGIPSWIFNNNTYRNFILTINFNFITTVNNINATATILLNGLALFSRTIFYTGNNKQASFNIRRYNNAALLIDGNRLNFGNNTLSIALPAGVDVNARPYEISIEFV